MDLGQREIIEARDRRRGRAGDTATPVAIGSPEVDARGTLGRYRQVRREHVDPPFDQRLEHALARQRRERDGQGLRWLAERLAQMLLELGGKIDAQPCCFGPS
jgi:hypothetical protein